MLRLFVVVLLMILHASQFASSEDKRDRQHCAATCPACYKNNPKLNCRNVTCSNPGNCTIFTRDSCGCCLICAKLEGQTCGGLYGKEGFCASGKLRCNVSENRALAGKISTVGVCKDKYCFRSCAKAKKSRVCGSDGKWYSSECELRKMRCDNKSSIVKADNNTVCEKNCPTSCTGIKYKPVCGSDKKRYSNECRLKQKACSSKKNITVAPPQICSNNPITFDPCLRLKCGQGAVCVKINRNTKTQQSVKCKCISATYHCIESVHVCGSDNVTYKSQCHMDAAACTSRKKITFKQSGDCRNSGSGEENIHGSPYTPPTEPPHPFHLQLKTKS